MTALAEASSSSSSVKSAERTLSILSYLATKHAPVPCMTIARACCLPRSSTYHLLNVLLDRGFVIHYPDRRRWGLGAAVVPIADAFRRSRPLPWLGAAVFDQLVHGVVLAASLHRLEDGCLSACAERAGAARVRVDPLRDPAHREAAALALVVGCDADESRRRLRQLGRSSADLRFLEGFGAEVGRGRVNGFVVRAGAEPGVTHLAVPVIDDLGTARAALVLACRTAPAAPDTELVRQLRLAARDLSDGFAPRGLAAA